MRKYPPLHWIIIHDRNELNKIDREKKSEVWKELAIRLADEEIIFAIEMGEFLVDNKLFDEWLKGFCY